MQLFSITQKETTALETGNEITVYIVYKLLFTWKARNEEDTRRAIQ